MEAKRMIGRVLTRAALTSSLVGVATPAGAAAAENDSSVLRVRVAFQVNLPATRNPEEQRRQMAIARRQIYDSAFEECAALTEILRGGCRLVSLDASSSLVEKSGAGPTITADGAAEYELSARAR
jgi:hypothetical protein